MRRIIFSCLMVLLLSVGIAQADLIDNGDGTVSDSRTGLMWQQDSAGSMAWAEAVAYCSRLSLAGYDDWRLPSLDELKSIVNGDFSDPAIDTTFFPDTKSDHYWSSAKSDFQSNQAWHLDFARGHAYEGFTLQQYYVRAVR